MGLWSFWTWCRQAFLQAEMALVYAMLTVMGIVVRITIGMVLRKENFPPSMVVTAFICGGVFACFGYKIAILWLNLPSDAIGLACFICGLCGLGLAVVLIDSVSRLSLSPLKKRED